MSKSPDDEIRDIEYLILLILGKIGGKISILHLQKIFFLLWKFHPYVRGLVKFDPHIKGPYSPDLQDLIKNPIYLVKCWRYIPPKKDSNKERILGGYLQITGEGEKIYQKLFKGLKEKAKKDKNALALISALDLLVRLYGKLEWDELLFLLYTDESNKEYSKRSELSKKVLENAEKIVDRLIKKGIIIEEMKEDLLRRAKESKWLYSNNDKRTFINTKESR